MKLKSKMTYKCLRSYNERTHRLLCKTFILTIICFTLCVMYQIHIQMKYGRIVEDELLTVQNLNLAAPLWERKIDFEGFDNNTGTENGCYLVPNIIHYIKLDERKFSFTEFICIVSVYLRQRPEYIFIHTNVEQFLGKYWDLLFRLKMFSSKSIITPIRIPEEIFIQYARNDYRVTTYFNDVLRYRILQEFGGIFLDTHMYQVNNMDNFRKYELVLGWKYHRNMGYHILIAHKDARFLKEYTTQYLEKYKINDSKYNREIMPTEDILRRKPYLVHRVEEKFGYDKFSDVFTQKWLDWKNYYTVYLGNLYENQFEDFNIGYYVNITFFDMVYEVFDIAEGVPRETILEIG